MITGPVRSRVRPPARTTKRPSGRPRVYTERAIADALCKSFGSVTEAANILRCSPRLIRAALDRSPRLKESKRQGEGEIFDEAFSNVVGYQEMGNVTAAMFLYELLGPEYDPSDFRPEVTDVAPIKRGGAGREQITDEELASLSEEDLRLWIRAEQIRDKLRGTENARESDEETRSHQ